MTEMVRERKEQCSIKAMCEGFEMSRGGCYSPFIDDLLHSCFRNTGEYLSFNVHKSGITDVKLISFFAVLILLSSTVLAALEPFTDGICTFLDFNEMVSVIQNICGNADVICIVANLCQPAGISVETGDTDTSAVVDAAMHGIGYYDMDV